MTDWIILRCSSSSTLRLAESLAEAGFETWTPVEVVQRRARRSLKRDEVAQAMIPTFVFAEAHRLAELIALSHSPSLNFRVWDTHLRRMVTKGHPPFRVFGKGGIRPIADRELSHLRLTERRVAPKAMARAYAPGEQVRMTEGGFAGLTGTVDEQKGQYVTVSFPGWSLPVKVAAWVLLPQEMEQAA